jgi:hypothetical protein
MGHFDKLRTGFDRLSPNGVNTSTCRINNRNLSSLNGYCPDRYGRRIGGQGLLASA